MKMFIPAVGDRIRLTADAVIDCVENHYANTLPHPQELWRVERGEAAYDWHAANALRQFTLVEGTILEFKRLFISRHAKEDSVLVTIFASPRADLTIRKNGGSASSKVELTMTNAQINQLDYERFEL